MTPLDRAWRRVVGYFKAPRGGARRMQPAGRFNTDAAFGK
jgi:hypothetical protein